MSRTIVIPIVAGIGNALMAVPTVRQAAASGARVTILARSKAMAEVFTRLAGLEAVIPCGGGAGGVKRMISAARRLRPDVYLVPFPSNRWQYSMLAFTSGARQRLLHGYPVGYFRALHFLPATRRPARRGIHDVIQNLELLPALGIEPDLSDAPTFTLSAGDRSAADALLAGAGLDAETSPLVVHAGSARTVLARAKRWPPANYARLIEALDQRFPGRIVLVEGPDEAGVGDEIAAAFAGVRGADSASTLPAKVVKLIGSLGTAGALLERAALYVGSDSGLAHLAAAVGTPPVTIFGPADPERVCPYGYRSLVVSPTRSCGPCFLYPWDAPYPKIRCRPPFCIESITVESVLKAVDRAAAQSAPVAGSPAAGVISSEASQ